MSSTIPAADCGFLRAQGECVLHIRALSPERTKCTRSLHVARVVGLLASPVHPAHPNTSSPFVHLIGPPAPSPTFSGSHSH